MAESPDGEIRVGPSRRWTISVRSLMLFVLMVAAVGFAGLTLRRRQEYLGEWEVHKTLAKQHQDEADGQLWFAANGGVAGHNPPDHAWQARLHRELARKYERAARQPWRAVEPDSHTFRRISR